MPSFAEGFASGLSGQIEEHQQQMNKLALLSKQIEEQSKARMAEQQQLHELNTLPKGALAASLGVLGVDADKARVRVLG